MRDGECVEPALCGCFTYQDRGPGGGVAVTLVLEPGVAAAKDDPERFIKLALLPVVLPSG